MYTSLLQRQIKRYLPEDTIIPPEWTNLLEGINRSYEHYERDHILGKRSLEISTQELRQLTLELSEKETRILAILQAAKDGILVINTQNIIVICNQAAADFLGFAHPNKLIGKDVSLIQIAFLDKKEHSTSFAEIFHLLEKHLFELFIVRENTFFPIELSLSKFKLQQEEMTVCILRDISIRKQSEKKISVRHLLTRQLFGAISLQDAASKVLLTLCVELGWDVGLFWRIESQDSLIQLFSHYENEFPAFKKFIEKMPPFSNPENPKWRTTEARFLSAPFVSLNNLDFSEFRACQFQSIVIFPIFFEENLYGFIELFAQTLFPKDDAISRIFRDIGSEFGLFIENQNIRERELNLQKRLVSVAKQVGIMEVTNSVLHNVRKCTQYD